MRLIDADETISELKALPEQERLEYMGVYDLLKSLPTIDAEPVVRCKDCEHRNKEYGIPLCELNGGNTGDEFYCGCGVKRNEDAEQ